MRTTEKHPRSSSASTGSSGPLGRARRGGRSGARALGRLAAHALIAGASLLAALVLLAAPSAAIAAGCPNESIRQQQNSTYLPDCMALEMVSPPVKFGGIAQLPVISANGERIAFRSRAALADTPLYVDPLLGDWYVSSRGTDGWTDAPTSPPASGGFQAAEAFSPDFGSWITAQASEAQLILGQLTAFQGGLDSSWTPRSGLLTPQGGLIDPAVTRNVSYLAASEDLSHLYLEPGLPEVAYLPGDPRPSGADGARNIYVLTRQPGGGSNISLLSRDSTGKVWGGTCGAWVGGGEAISGRRGGRNQGAVSQVGMRVYFSTRPAQAQPIPGEPTKPLCDTSSTTNPIRIMTRRETAAGPEIEELFSAGPAAGNDFYEGASANGELIYFTTTRPLVDSDTDSGAECSTAVGASQGCDLYLYDASRPSGERIIQVSAGEGSDEHPVPGSGAEVIRGVTAISGDGSRVYYVATGVLTSAPNPEGDVAVAPATGSGTPSYGSGFAATVAGSDQVTVGFVVKGAFETGQSITGAGIPSGTTITAVAGNTLTLSAAATASASFASLTGSAKLITDVSTTSGEFVVGQTITGPGIPDKTTITAVTPEGLELSAMPTDGGVQPLSAAGFNLYLYEADNSKTTFIGTLAPGDSNLIFGQGSHTYFNDAAAVPLHGRDALGTQVGGDGHILVFQSSASLTSDDTDGGRVDIYRYDADSGSLLRISKAAPGGSDNGPFDVEHPEKGFRQLSDSAEKFRWVSEDGRTIAFLDREPLVPGDTDERPAAFMWREGGDGTRGLTLLPGGGVAGVEGYPTLPTVSADGDEVAFTSARPLVPSDGDAVADIYAARVDGGFATESGAGGECVAEACQGQAAVPPSATVAPTSTLVGRGNQKRQRPRHCHPKKASKKKGSTRRGSGKCVKVKRHHRHRHRDAEKKSQRVHGSTQKGASR